MKRLILEADLDMRFNGHTVKIKNDHEKTILVELSDLTILKSFIRSGNFTFIKSFNRTLYKINVVVKVIFKNNTLLKLGTAKNAKIKYLKLFGLLLKSLVRS